MGLLLNGDPLSWIETRKLKDQAHVRATAHILEIYQREKDREGDEPLWGDEVPFIFIHPNLD